MKNKVKEVVILSGKGGTGKTSLTAAFASLVPSLVLADCDVDGSDLHLVTSPTIIKHSPYIEGKVASVDPLKCTGCGLCDEACRFDSFKIEEDGTYQVIEYKCEGCGLCVHVCPENAINFDLRECGEWMVSETRFGPMVHAALLPAGENSGLLVTVVRNEARKIAQKGNYDLILIDGPPGIGCPVISSVTGTSAVILVTEPTVSGIHDLKRVAALADNFKVKAYIVVNRSTVNEQLTEEIEMLSEELGHKFVGTIPFDNKMVLAQLEGKSAIEFIAGDVKKSIERIWERIWQTL
ncbi:MAG: ATP-binding protein [Sphaerochaetaceae bacterium]|jgi:MinD superfamily P-loop ATPase